MGTNDAYRCWQQRSESSGRGGKRPWGVTSQRGDASHAREVLGWEPTVGFEEIVARMVAADTR